jgi:hypothetical protein
VPWKITDNDAACPASKPWGVREEATDLLVGCHPSRSDAMAQVVALHASEALSAALTTLDDLDLKPTAAMAEEAQRGLDWRNEFGRGGTAVGVARARDLSNRAMLSPETVLRMNSYFARHAVDSRGEGYRPGENGFPSAGRIAWALWGGDPGESWARVRAGQIQRIRNGG